MIGLDTNVLARTILNDDPKWSPIAIDFVLHKLTVDDPGYVNLVTFAELLWTLRKAGGFGRTQLAAVVGGLLAADNIIVQEADLVGNALVAFEAGGAGFADYLIAELNRHAGATHTVTLDRDAAGQPPFVPLS